MAAQHPTAETPNTDVFGFSQAASRISTTLQDTANHVGSAVRRSRALLRTLQFQLLNDDPRNLISFDMEALVELALSALPEPDGEAFDTFESCAREARQAVKTMLAQQEAMTAMLTALDVAADLGSTREELNEVADGAYAAATVLLDGQRHWDAFCALITRRGLTVELFDLAPGVVRPNVDTPEGKRRSAKLIRKAIAVAEELRAGAGVTSTAKRRKGKA